MTSIPLESVFLRTTLATLVAFAGGAAGVLLSTAGQRHLKMLVYAAMGALLAVTVFDVLPDAKTLLPWPAFLASAASGAGLFWVIGKYVSPICPSCSISVFDNTATVRLGQTAAWLMAALAVHSTMDGVAVVVGDAINGRPNLAVLLAVSFHKFPEGLALALLLRGAGYAPRAALGWTLGIESSTELGGLTGVLALRHASLPVLGMVFAHVGGGFLYLIGTTLGVVGLRPTVQSQGRARGIAASAGLAFAGTSLLIWAFHHLTA